MFARTLTRLQLPRETGLILVLFLSFRLMILASLWPVTLVGDYPYYYTLAQLSDRGLWPYLHYWMEYPPIFPLLSTLVYRLTAGGGYDAFAFALGAVNTLFGAGNLILLMRLMRRTHGEATAVRWGWVYTALAAPVMITWWQYETLTAFCLLFALDRLLDRRDVSSAVVTGVGVMVKLVPALIIPALALARPFRKTLVYLGVVAAVVALILAPLLLAAPQTTVASLASPLGWSSWETVWALIDGNYRTGLLGDVDTHFDNRLATVPLGNPSRVPDSLKAVGFGLIFLALLRRFRSLPEPSAPADVAYRTTGILTVTYVIFLLWSKGWSPQWQMILIPLIALMMPDRSGVGFILVFQLVNLAEWPILITREMWNYVTITVLLRTLLLILLLAEVTQRCVRRSGTSVRREAAFASPAER